MIPQHISDVLKTLSKEQQNKFTELISWAGQSGIKGSTLWVNYDRILEMVLSMGPAPIVPIEAPIVEEEPLIKEKQKE